MGQRGNSAARPGLFFGLGGYALAMHLKLAALGPGELPDFMQWNGLESLPWLWRPFENGALSLVAAAVIPTALAAALAWLLFHRRVGGVYFAIITQALALAATTFIISQQPYTGGFNGLTDFGTAFGFSLADQSTQTGLYWITVSFLASPSSAHDGCWRRSSAKCCARFATAKTASAFSATIPLRTRSWRSRSRAAGRNCGRAVHAQHRRDLARDDRRGAID